MDFLTIILILIGGIAIGGLVVYEGAVRYFRKRDKGRQQRTDRLTSEVATLQNGLLQDPARLGIDLGKEYAVNEMDKTIRRIREEL